MKVWIVWSGVLTGDDQVDGVFGSRESAEAYVAKEIRERGERNRYSLIGGTYPDDDYDIDEHEVRFT